ncbi:SGNH/GDSL hydrolase family protein [Aeromonas rivipollensis]|uniref:SGNH/GDSL hydrolase family protein n=1 Tax=Aeromonas rivipollensis TaxID=948519 RepID=UPI00372CFFD1
MYWPDTKTGVDIEPARKPVASAVRKFFTEGGVGQAPTVPGGDFFNQITNELLNVVVGAGIDPSKTDDDQLLAAIRIISDSILRDVLAANDGASLIGFGDDTAADVMSDTSITPDSQGASGDGVIDDSSFVSSAVSFSGSSLQLRKGRRYLSPSFSNPLGKPMFGAGHLVNASLGGLEAKTTYADHYQRVTGLENLATWLRLIYDQISAPSRPLKMVFTGDSATSGDGVSIDYQIHKLVRVCVQKKGLQTPYGIQSINAGHSGAHTGQWDATYVTQDAALAPDLYVVRWGINDPGYLKDGSSPPIDAGQNYPNRRDVNDFAASLRSGLSKFRSIRSFQQTSILLMMPNSTYDIPNGRDALWYEQLRDVYVQAARDYNCAFIDTYAIMQDSKYLAGILMDDPMPTPGRGIHPNDVMNSVIAGYIADTIAPEGLGAYMANNSVLCLGGAELLPSVTEPPASFKLAAVSMYRAGVSAGWPIDGHALTFRTPDDTALQLNFGFKNADRGKLKIRYGRMLEVDPGESSGWSGWFDVVIGKGQYTPAGVGGFVANTAKATLTGSMVVIDGRIDTPSPLQIVDGTVIATLPVEVRPTRDDVYINAVLFDGVSRQLVSVLISPSGQVFVVGNSVSTAINNIYLMGSFSVE